MADPLAPLPGDPAPGGAASALANPIASSTAIDLSRLPAPRIVEALDFEAQFDQLRAAFVARWPAFSALVESDPVIKLLELVAYQLTLLRGDFNDRARGTMIAFATGTDLDQLAALYGLARLVVAPADPVAGAPARLEEDEEFRRRVTLAPDALSVAGPAAAYLFHALSADGAIIDAAATSPAPGEVLVSVLARPTAQAPDGAPGAALLAKIAAALSADTVRPLTDRVTVVAATPLPVDVDVVLTIPGGPDPAPIVAAADAAMRVYLDRSRRIGRGVARSALIAAAHVGGVERVDLIAPAEDVPATPHAAPWPRSIAIATRRDG